MPPLYEYLLMRKRSLQTDPVLKQLDVLLEDDQLFQQMKADLTGRFAHTADRGRHSTPVEAILRPHKGELKSNLGGW